MSAQTQKVDVLANIKDAIKRTSPTTHFNERANLWATHDAMAEVIEAARLGGDMPKKEGAEHAGMFFTADNAVRLRAALAALAGGAA